MGMKQTLDVVNALEADGVIGRYAISGAIAAYNYIEASVTDDLVVLVSFDEWENSRRPDSLRLRRSIRT
jgi:hypothetical protein